MHYTHPALPSQLPSITLLCTQLTDTKHSWQNGPRYKDGVNVLWCCAHLVWLVFESSIPTCAWFHLENFFVNCYIHVHSFQFTVCKVNANSCTHCHTLPLIRKHARFSNEVRQLLPMYIVSYLPSCSYSLSPIYSERTPTQEVSWLLEWYTYTLSYIANHRQTCKI